MTRIFYKLLNSNSVYCESLSPIFSLTDFFEKIGTDDYVLLDGTNTDYDECQECLKIENGVLEYDLTLLKEAVHKVRKENFQVIFKPFDKVFEDIYAKRIPASELGNSYSALEIAAEYERTQIRQQSEAYKNAINIATQASTVLAIWQELKPND